MIILKALFFLWELPQNLIGLLLYRKYKKNNNIQNITHEYNRMFIKVKKGAVSLGYFIFWSDEGTKYFDLNGDNKMHEYGHSVQSRIFGPLYIFVIVIPSVFRVITARKYYEENNKVWDKYYDGFPENWAEKIAKRKKKSL